MLASFIVHLFLVFIYPTLYSLIFHSFCILLFLCIAFEKTLVYKGQDYLVQLVDTAGQVMLICTCSVVLVQGGRYIYNTNIQLTNAWITNSWITTQCNSCISIYWRAPLCTTSMYTLVFIVCSTELNSFSTDWKCWYYVVCTQTKLNLLFVYSLYIVLPFPYLINASEFVFKPVYTENLYV